MAKDTTRYECSECGHHELRWMGRCPDCGAWNTLEAVRTEREPTARTAVRRRAASGNAGSAPLSRPTPIREIPSQSLERRPVEPEELSRVLGGGIVPGSLILLGGAPGVGKSTLLTMLCGQLAARGETVVYLTAEESAAQVRARAQRLGAEHDHFFLVEQPVLERVLPPLYDSPPALLVVDSIQTVMSEEVDGAPGLISQGRACSSISSIPCSTSSPRTRARCAWSGHSRTASAAPASSRSCR